MSLISRHFVKKIFFFFFFLLWFESKGIISKASKGNNLEPSVGGEYLFEPT